MELTKEDKSNLKSLLEHRWFAVFEKMFKDEEYKLLSKFKKLNLWDEKTATELYWVQNYVAWMEHLINTAKGKSQEVKKQKSLQ